MSSTSSPSLSATSTASSSPSASTTSSGNNGGGFSPPSSTLYLLTFLATLFVLLFVSCAIVLRSFFIRRRFRRQVEEQIAAGLLPPEAGFHFGRRDFGEKPKLWDVAVLPSPDAGPWSAISPVSALTLSHELPSEPGAQAPSHPQPPYSPPHTTPLRRLLSRRRPPPNEPPEAGSFDASRLDEGAQVQVAVLLAMPSPRKDWHGEGVPEVVVGVSQISLRKDEEK